MGYSKPIETENAIYVINFENHGSPNFDVLKSYRFDYAVGEQKMNFEHDSAVSSGLRKFAEKTNLPILLVDPLPANSEQMRYTLYGAGGVLGIGASALMLRALSRTATNARREKRKLSRREWFRMIGLGVTSGVLSAPTLLTIIHKFRTSSKDGVVDTEESIVRWMRKMDEFFLPIVAKGRNAVIAEKVDGSLAPKLKQELGRKPRILIHLGASHTGIVRMLQQPAERRETLKEMGDSILKGLENEHLDKAFRVRWDPRKGAFDVKIEKTELIALLHNERRGGMAPIKRREPASMTRRGLFSRLRPRRA